MTFAAPYTPGAPTEGVWVDHQQSSVHFVRSQDGTKIAFRSRGSGDVVVFARGWMSHLEYSEEDPSIRAFFGRLEQHFQVVRYDGRGQGLSERALPPDLSLDHLVDDLASVVEVTGRSKVILWGSSWAGPTAIQYASTHPERINRLILEGTFALGSELTSPERAASFMTLLETARFQPDAVYASMSYLTDPEPGMSHSQRIARTRATIEPDALIQLHALLYDMDVTEHLEDVQCPTLVLHRRGSSAVPLAAARHLAAGIRGARLTELEGREHNLWEGDSEPVYEALAEFLATPELAHSEDPTERSRIVSVVFIDQVSSTEQMRQLGDQRGVEVQDAMISLLKYAAAPFGAEAFSDTGDGVVFLVPTASDAVAVAQVIQRRIVTHNETVAGDEIINIRVGVHTGEVRTSDSGRTSGLVIAYASRLCDVAGAGEIVASGVTRRDAESAIGVDDFTELPAVDLKGIGKATPHRVSW